MKHRVPLQALGPVDGGQKNNTLIVRLLDEQAVNLLSHRVHAIILDAIANQLDAIAVVLQLLLLLGKLLAFQLPSLNLAVSLQPRQQPLMGRPPMLILDVGDTLRAPVREVPDFLWTVPQISLIIVSSGKAIVLRPMMLTFLPIPIN